ncbi:hypothetical protein J2S53_001387 [Actinopolyspora lacussalsi]|nr:hypothetical protein [Actinopolyspora lacussalsi]
MTHCHARRPPSTRGRIHGALPRETMRRVDEALRAALLAL